MLFTITEIKYDVVNDEPFEIENLKVKVTKKSILKLEMRLLFR